MVYYILAAIVIVLCLYWTAKVVARRAGLKQMALGIDIVKMGIGVRLLRRYAEFYDSSTATKLAVAVMNEIFGDPAGTPEAAAFLRSNQELVLSEIQSLSDDDEIREALTQAMRVKCLVAYARGKRSAEEVHAPIRRLDTFGLLVPGGESPSRATFLALVETFSDDIRT